MRAVLTLMTAMVAACAAPATQVETAPAPPVFDPAGTYDFTTQVEGQAISGTMVVHRDAQGVLVARISTPMTGEFAASVTPEGRKLGLRADTGNGIMVMTFTVAEDETIAGSWNLDTGMSGTVTGKRRPPA